MRDKNVIIVQLVYFWVWIFLTFCFFVHVCCGWLESVSFLIFACRANYSEAIYYCEV